MTWLGLETLVSYLRSGRPGGLFLTEGLRESDLGVARPEARPDREPSALDGDLALFLPGAARGSLKVNVALTQHDFNNLTSTSLCELCILHFAHLPLHTRLRQPLQS